MSISLNKTFNPGKILRGYFLPLLFLLNPVSAFLEGGGSCSVSFEGIYTASIDEETDGHIRFYKDGVVLVSTSVKDIKDVKTWFHKENEDRVLRGKYKLRKCNIRFSVSGETGEQIYSGQVSGDELILTIENGKNKARTTRVYKLIPI
jgi:hypothetical protein